jgi:hypothetical protein
VHVSTAQTVPAGYLWQPPAPSQRPLVPQEAGVWAVQTPRGSALPGAMGMHRPGALGSPQLRHAPVQALSQQTPSTQWLLAHSLAVLQTLPSLRGPQFLLTHATPGAQSASLPHVTVQAPSTQR